jgi:hypothetical protein
MRKWTTWGVALALAITGGQALAKSTPSPASEEQVRQLMEAVGVGKMLAQMNAQAVTNLQQSMPCVQADFWQNYMDANQTQLFIGRLVPVYQRHFTADEMEGLLKFYRSPLGQKVITEMPNTMAEANQAGQQWSHERSEQMISELKQMGTLDGSGRCPAKVATTPVAGAAALTAAAGHDESDGEEGEAPAKAAAKAPAKSKTHTTTKKAPAKTAAKKPATTSKTPAKTDAKAPAKSDVKAAPAKTTTQASSQAGQ